MDRVGVLDRLVLNVSGAVSVAKSREGFAEVNLKPPYDGAQCHVSMARVSQVEAHLGSKHKYLRG